jgi:beta-glucosidase
LSSFPEGFLWGTATAGHQVEGDNRHSNWWAHEQQPGWEQSGRACDTWNRYAEDHALMAEHGHGVYRLGIEWARVEPREGEVDGAVLAHYRTMLDDLQGRGIKVCLTLNHWVLPAWFADRGGWLVRAALGSWERYLRTVVPALAPAVDLWITLNEPMVPVLAGYLLGHHPPCRRAPREAGRVFCQLLRAHALAYGLVHELVPGAQVGFAGAVQHVETFHTGLRGLIERPLAAMFKSVSYGAWEQSLLTGRAALPFGRRQRISDLAGSFDFVGVNYYTRISAGFVRGALSNVEKGAFACPAGIETTQMGWQVYPPGFHTILCAAHRRFGKPLYVTENGCATEDDALRRRYLVTHFAQMQRAIDDGADVRGYFLWSLLDNFEWREGTVPKFGIVAVDFDDPDLPRRPRGSAQLYREVIAANALTAEIAERHAPGALAEWS